MKGSILILLSIVVCCSSCYDDPLGEDRIVQGYAPIYANFEVGDRVSESPRPYDELTNFVLSNDLIFMVDLAQGVHVVDNKNPDAPLNIGFLNVAGAIGLVVKDDHVIIATSYRLVSINISDIDNAVISSITILDGDSSIELLPPDDFSDFECVDSQNGILIGWEQKLLTNPQCWK